MNQAAILALAAFQVVAEHCPDHTLCIAFRRGEQSQSEHQCPEFSKETTETLQRHVLKCVGANKNEYAILITDMDGAVLQALSLLPLTMVTTQLIIRISRVGKS